MKTPNSTLRILVAASAVVLLAALATSAIGCTSASSAASVPVAQTAPAAAPAAEGKATAAGNSGAATPAGPSPAQGKAVVKSSCVGQCHGSNILSYRTSPTSAQRIAQSMGRRAGLSADKQQAVATFFAQ